MFAPYKDEASSLCLMWLLTHFWTRNISFGVKLAGATFPYRARENKTNMQFQSVHLLRWWKFVGNFKQSQFLLCDMLALVFTLKAYKNHRRKTMQDVL